MLIGVSGKIGSGKDTVGTLIQHLICESKGHAVYDYQLLREGGTMELIDYLKTIPNALDYQSGWEIKKFAGKLKRITALLTGCTIEQLESQKFKDSNLGPEWNRKLYGNYTDAEYLEVTTSYRELLQKIGTEAMRDNVHPEVWINALFADYHPTPNKSMDESFEEQFTTGRSEIHYQLPNWIITDMRFPNEFDAVKARGGITIRVERKKFPIEHSVTGETHLLSREAFVEHPSETSLDNHNFDYLIHNDGSISDLIDSVKEVLRKTKII